MPGFSEWAQRGTDTFNRGLAGAFGSGVDIATEAINAALRYGGAAGVDAGLWRADQVPAQIDPAQAVGGTEWLGRQMERAGVVSTARNPTAEFLASLLIPIAFERVRAASVVAKALPDWSGAQPTVQKR